MSDRGGAATWAVYIRRSYVETTAAEVSDETQLETATRLVPAGAPVVVIRDSGGHNSGRNDRRNGFQRMMAMLAAGQLAGIVAYDPWRLARNTRLTLNLLHEVNRQGVDIRFVTMPQSLRGATGHFALTVYAAAGQLQADADSERMKAQLRGVFEAGGHRGHSPFGYESKRDHAGNLVHPRQLVVVPEEADVVRLVWRELREYSFNDVADRLNSQGAMRRGTRSWTRDAVKDLWRRGRVYLGLVVEKRGLDERPGLHEPILDEATYSATVAAVRTRTRAGKKPKPFRTYLLRGVISCGCGARMRGEARVQRGSERRYYRCPRAGRYVVQHEGREPVRCGARLVPAEAAEHTVLNEIGEAALPPRVVEAAREELRRRLGAPRDGIVDRRRQRLTTRLDQLRKQHEWADISDEAYRKARADTQAALAQLPDGDKLVLFDRNRRVLGTLAANIAMATTAQRAELVSLLVDRAVARDGHIDPTEISWTPPARPFFAPRWLECPQGDSNP